VSSARQSSSSVRHLTAGPVGVIISEMLQMTSQLAASTRARFFHGLADPARLAILDALRNGERTSGEVATAAGLTLSSASRHLACLRDCGLLEARPEWRFVHYRLADGVADLLKANDVFIARVADRVAGCQRPEMGDG
jgi:ArsR family transcriptional regulator, cadmium/lead-responsive transcriptional repressor